MKELIYEYLTTNCVGIDNRVKGWELMKKFNIKDHKTLRGYIQDLRQDENLDKLIGSLAGKNGGFYIISSYDEFKNTTEHLYLRAMEMLKTYSIMKRKEEHQKFYRMEI